eukprot:779146-Rhodomonas_salina.1
MSLLMVVSGTVGSGVVGSGVVVTTTLVVVVGCCGKVVVGGEVLVSKTLIDVVTGSSATTAVTPSHCIPSGHSAHCLSCVALH